MAEYQQFHVVHCPWLGHGGVNDSGVISSASPRSRRCQPLRQEAPAAMSAAHCPTGHQLLEESIFQSSPLVIRHSGRAMATNTRLVNYLMII